MVTFHINDSAKPFENEIRYTLGLWAISQRQEITFSSRRDKARIIGLEPDSDIRVSTQFTGPASSSRAHPFIRLDGTATDHFDPTLIDLLGSAFQMVNALQEYSAPEYDELNRYQFKTSYQHRLNNVNDNLVLQCFDAISNKLNLPLHQEPTRFFLSHDIDIVYGAILEDGNNVLRKGRIDLFLKMLFNLAMARPEWLNMDQIMSLESAHDCKSIFFWIVNKGRINSREENADYQFQSKPIQRQYEAVAAAGFENGLHKSLSPDSFREEFTKYGNVPYANRYHFLK